MTTPPRPSRKPSSAVNHRISTPRSPQNPTPTAKRISKSPESNRIFTENDEIQLLKTLSESKDTTFPSPNSDFTGTQIAKKVSRLKEKYHKFARSKSLMKTPHDHKIYEMGRKIWGRKASKGREKESLVENLEVSKNEDVDLEDFPFLVSEMMKVFSRSDYCNEGLKKLGKEKLKSMNEKWMELKLEESELMVNKAKLNHEQLKLVIESCEDDVAMC